eukprot:6481797-Amphidinium_carterae.1
MEKGGALRSPSACCHPNVFDPCSWEQQRGTRRRVEHMLKFALQVRASGSEGLAWIMVRLSA